MCMCILCWEIQKQQMTIREVARACGEIKVPEEHEDEVIDLIDRMYGAENVLAELEAMILDDLLSEYQSIKNKILKKKDGLKPEALNDK